MIQWSIFSVEHVVKDIKCLLIGKLLIDFIIIIFILIGLRVNLFTNVFLLLLHLLIQICLDLLNDGSNKLTSVFELSI